MLTLVTMEQFLRKYRLIDDLTINLSIDKADFIQRFRQQIEPGDTGFIGNPFEAFSSNDREFRGQVDVNGFTVRQRRKFFQPYAGIAKADGTFRQEREQLQIQTTVNGFNGLFTFYYIAVTVFYVIFLFTILLVEEIPLFITPFLLFHAVLMYGIPYFVMRGSVQSMKRLLERELFYLTKGWVETVCTDSTRISKYQSKIWSPLPSGI